jgi:hypothetical protein
LGHICHEKTTQEIRPASAWNYAILPGDNETAAIETTVADTMPPQPFRAADSPVRLTLKAARTDQGGWGTYQDKWPGRAVEPPTSPVKTVGQTEDIVLVPYGSTEIRITCFPWSKGKK